jgi:hemolysin III
MAAALAEDVRPTWRGRLHRWAAISFVPLFALLIARADGGTDRLAVAVYAFGVTAMLGVSAVYHSGKVGPVAFRRLKRLDHSTILLAIAGSYTAVTALSLDGSEKTRMLLVVWVAAVLGITIRMAWLDAPYPLVAVVYLIVGWIALVDLPGYLDALSGTEMAFVVFGGLLYTGGGVVYALHKPNPWPATFGYHEVFHALVVAGAAAHYVAVLLLVT